MTKALVTGGAGFIGSHVVDGYLAEGLEVVVVDDLSRGARENVSPRARFCRADIRDRAALQALFQLFHNCCFEDDYVLECGESVSAFSAYNFSNFV
jgi:nucleoside-diphosphate-sugar epimerase